MDSRKIQYPETVKTKNNQMVYLTDEIKMQINQVKGAIKANNTPDSDYKLGQHFEALKVNLGLSNKDFVDYVNANFTDVSCWAQTNYEIKVRYPNDSVKPFADCTGPILYYQIISEYLNPDYIFYVRERGSGSCHKDMMDFNF